METKKLSVKDPARVSARVNLLSRLFPVPIPYPIPIPLQLNSDRNRLIPRGRVVGRASRRHSKLIPEIMAPQRSWRTLEFSVAHFQPRCYCVFRDLGVKCDGAMGQDRDDRCVGLRVLCVFEVKLR